MCIIINIHDDLSHSIWKGIEDMKTPGMSSLWISPIFNGKTRINKCFEKCLSKLAILKSYIYITYTHTWDQLIHILTKESKLKESSSYFSFLYLWGGRDKGRRFLLQGLSQLQTSSYLLVGSWFMIFISRPYYHPLLLPCGTRVVIIEMWPHSRRPCGRLLRNVVILEMWHLAFPKGTYVLSFSILTSSLYWSFGWIKVYKQFMVFACHVTNIPALYISSNASIHFYSFISRFSSNF